MDKMGTRVGFDDTCLNGSKYLHGIGNNGVTLEAPTGKGKERTALLKIRLLDAALVAPRSQARLPNFESGPAVAESGPNVEGIAFNLVNNMWLTNYVSVTDPLHCGL